MTERQIKQLVREGLRRAHAAIIDERERRRAAGDFFTEPSYEEATRLIDARLDDWVYEEER